METGGNIDAQTDPALTSYVTRAVYIPGMKPAKPSLLLHPVFLLSLLLLVLNDAFWKPAFGNFLTGKLSDVTGLLVFAVTFITIFPNHRKSVLVLTAIGFTWWKSESSQGFIDWLRSDLHLELTRVVDYTDLAALVVLILVPRLRPVAPRWQWLRPLVLSGAFVAMIADTPPRYVSADGSYYSYRTFTAKKTRPQVLEQLNRSFPGISEDTGRIYELPRRDILLKSTDSATGTVQWVSLMDEKDLQVFQRQRLYQTEYVIPLVVAGSDSFFRVRFALNHQENTQKTQVQLHSFYLTRMEEIDFRSQRLVSRRKGKALKQRLKAALED